jgi:N4-bis(aminopropyl)spermidine synthase
MAQEFDLREAFNVISDVIVNRPTPLREFDQIHMKVADMLLQAQHVSKWVNGMRMLFIGDGDGVGLTLLHLKAAGVLERGPSSIHLLDFDERVLESVERFAGNNGLAASVKCTLYNVADPLPADCCRAYDCFYTNPPFGSANEGASVKAFVQRGIEGTGDDSVGCIVAADNEALPWSGPVLRNTQRLLSDNGFMVAEMIPAFHTYHLPDLPTVTSCSLIARRVIPAPAAYMSLPLAGDEVESFYGREKPLSVRYVRKGADASPYVLEPFTRQETFAGGTLWS